jgi:hypothetical protein
VSAWRRRALEFFPFLRHAIQRPESTIYKVFLLLPCVSEVFAYEAKHAEGIPAGFSFHIWQGLLHTKLNPTNPRPQCLDSSTAPRKTCKSSGVAGLMRTRSKPDSQQCLERFSHEFRQTNSYC